MDWIAIDGKSLKNTLTNYENQKQNMLIMVSWFSQETKLVIKSESFESKQNSENAKVLSMIEKCGLFKVFTLDALHCSKATTQAIIESKNDYLIPAKGNQVKLHKRIKNLAEIEKPLTVYEEKDVSHGRNVSRKVSVIWFNSRFTTR
ncbi:ISAs1 family transposase [Planktothrix sp. FACHB-1365]|uniref:ISAs1 family transposase n=1 Tax=Planktothrix sp. FACHB-1365 TaxID=2692855 RepID=UPI0016895914|nr:ISAs1 family transposase [Planktothrix sp. FACHB-1365]MBD2483052.1 ISAs1 family transposase [Planktothrix sp. FACHB-1365]